jgi:CPA2 family monovalent cation:H+ antiporter-2
VHGSVFLRDLAWVLAASLPVIFLFRKLKAPSIAAFLVTGMLIGPHAFGLVEDPARVSGIAELGVALILFFVGLEFPLARLKTMGRSALVGGSLQMAFAVGATAAALLAFGVPAREAVFAGLLVSVSSTAVVLPVLAARDELGGPAGKQFLGVALFQDLAVIPLVLLLPALAMQGSGAPGLAPVLTRVGVAAVGTVLLVAVARFLVPRILDRFVRVAGPETFTAAALVIVLGIVALVETAGASAAMGAFAAGIVLAESESIADVSSTFAPFRDVLSSLFFISVGMLFDPEFLAHHPGLVVAGAAFVVGAKLLTAYPALRIARAVPKTAVRASLALANIGEFSFVLALAGGKLGLLGESGQQLFVAVAVLTILLVPFVIGAGPALAARLPDLHTDREPVTSELRRGHVVVVGYGLNGSNVARVLGETGLKTIVVEADADRADNARRDGVPVLLADATGVEGLLMAGIVRARAIVVTIPDPGASRKVVQLCRSRNADVRIIVRTRYIREVEELRRAGADEVIPEEFETSIEIVARVLRSLHVPGNLIATQVRILRDEAYRKLRDPQARPEAGRRLSALMAAGTSDLVLILPEMAAVGKTLGELHLEEEHVAVPALLRDGAPLAPPPLDVPIEAGDTLLLVGAHEDLVHATKRLEGSGEERETT